jgi:hypothetical protein
MPKVVLFANGVEQLCGISLAADSLPSYVEAGVAESMYVVDFDHPDCPVSWQDVFGDAKNPAAQSLPAAGPGTELKKLLAGWPFFITSSPDCSCNRVAAEMDIWGPDECERPERVDYILAAMRSNAEKRGLPFIDAAGLFLVRRAIKNARKEQRLTT